jgi:hypothetical protein
VPLGTDKRDICSRNSFDFGERLRFYAATVTKIKISPGTPKHALEQKGNFFELSKKFTNFSSFDKTSNPAGGSL